MSDHHTGMGKNPGQEQGSEPTPQPEPSTGQQQRMYTEAQVAAARRQAEKELGEARAELDALKQERMTEAEKAQQEALAAQKAELERNFGAKEREYRIREALLAAGLDAEFQPLVAAKIGQDLGLDQVAAEAEKVIASHATLQTVLQAKNKPPVRGIAPAHDGGEKGIITWAQAHDPNYYREHQAEVDSALLEGRVQ